MTNDAPSTADDVLAIARAVLAAGPICDSCLGRAFARLGHGLSNAQRGRALRIAAVMLGTDAPVEAERCWVCEGLFDRVGAWASRALEAVERIEFDSYLFGVRLPVRVREMERFFDERFPTAWAEPLKHAFNREVGKAFERLVSRGTLDLTHPHLKFLLDIDAGTVDYHVLSLYVRGRYRKLARGIPQTRWPCGRCGGRGCPACGHTGKQYPESVEELIAAPFLTAASADEAHLHGAGREDIDARMLGPGRPFVLEVESPQVRKLDLSSLEAEVNAEAAGKVEVTGLRFVPRETVAWIKETRGEKAYRARVAFEADVAPSALSGALDALVGPIAQRTPNRVAHRRADLVRKRRLLEARGTLLAPREAQLDLRGEGGLYIKELVSGDGGRTKPSLAGRLGIACRVLELDVVDVRLPEPDGR
jgi:tRNA pseudouridine synthase 10